MPRRKPRPLRPLDVGPALLVSGYACAIALLLMWWSRQALQVRTLPERLMEWSTSLLSPALFEGAIDRFGPLAKDIALVNAWLGLAVVLLGLGVLMLRSVREPIAYLALGGALWFVAMAMVMPLTGGGWFATALPIKPWLTNAVYFGIGMAYAAALLLGRLTFALTQQPSLPASDVPPVRRALVATGAASLAAFGLTVVLGRGGATRGSNLPLAALNVAATPLPAPTPEPTSSPASLPTPAAASLAAAAASAPTATAIPATATPVPAAPTATPAPVYPEPPPAAALARDKDGVLTAAQRAKGQIQAAVQPNGAFYVVSKNAAGDPVLSARDWRLVVDGAVAKPVQIDYLTLRKLPPVTVYKTLECISNFATMCNLASFGCDLISTAQWTGVRLADVLALAGGVQPGAKTVVAFGADEYSSALPPDVAMQADVLLVYAMNGGVLPREHGFPVRLLVPGRYGMKNAKWVVNIKATTQPYVDWWGQRNWNEAAIVKTMSRIDTPVAGAKLAPGAHQIGGIAYAGDRGISKVEFSADGGATWQTAKVTPGPGKDTFAAWTGEFRLTAGKTVKLISRATDGTGDLQIKAFSLPQPNGGTGWNSIEVSAAGDSAA